jgi:hypothetical protein
VQTSDSQASAKHWVRQAQTLTTVRARLRSAILHTGFRDTSWVLEVTNSLTVLPIRRSGAS